MVRYIVYGAGGIGGVVGGRLAQHGHDVELIARGPHAAAIREHGLRVDLPDSSHVFHLPVAEAPAEITFTDDDVVLLAVKSQDTSAALDALALAAPPDIPVVCLQNGVANERMALRRFPNVYAVPVLCPTGHLEPGVVIGYSTPTTGIFDIGRFPSGSDELCATVAAAFSSSAMVSVVRDDVMRWKYAKLLNNLGNAIEALCGPMENSLDGMVRAEGEAVFRAAGIDFASQAEDRERRGDLIRIRPVRGKRRGGGSTWQSFTRGIGRIETDYLNGEVVQLGRLHGVPTPVNEALQRIATRLAAFHIAPGGMTEQEILAQIRKP